MLLTSGSESIFGYFVVNRGSGAEIVGGWCPIKMVSGEGPDQLFWMSYGTADNRALTYAGVLMSAKRN